MSTQPSTAGSSQRSSSRAAGVVASPPALGAAAVIGLLVAFALRLPLLDAFPLRDDEALYSAWALAARFDPFYLTTLPDKPPLFLWLQAIALALFGPTAAGARLLSIAAGVATVALMRPAARLLWPQMGVSAGAGVVALWLMALNPFAISFAPTAYTDSLLLFFALLALVSGLRGRWLAAGAALGAAIMTKQQGLLFAPLILLLPLVTRQGERSSSGGALRALLRMAGGLLLVVGPLLLWDASRWAVAPSPWDLGARNYGALSVAPLSTWALRAGEWATPAWHIAASPWVWLLLAACGAALIAATLGVGAHRPSGALWLLAAWGGAFALLHLFSTVQPWDRYLLPLVPVLVLVAAGPVSWGLDWLAGRHAAWVGAGALLLLLLLAPPARTATHGGYPVGADHGSLVGLDEVMATVRSAAEAAAAEGVPAPILFEQRLGWQARFYLADLLREGQVELRWFSSPAALVDSAAKSPHRARFVADPAWAPAADLAPFLAARGLRLESAGGAEQVRLYRMVESPAAVAPCHWCLNRLPALPEGWSRRADAGPGWTVAR